MDQVDGVMLAAGLSSRAGCYKMALRVGDKAVIQRSVEGMYDFVRRVHVVVGWQADRIRELLKEYGKVEIVRNEGFQEGMFSSVRAGIVRVRAPRFFLLPGDYPFIRSDVYKALLATSGDIVIPTFEGQRGHPVLIDSRLIPEILAQPADGTLRDFVRAKGAVTLDVQDEGILIDIDTPQDCTAARARSGGGPASQ
jgi:molybdenum cofactor cytidylyltransferase